MEFVEMNQISRPLDTILRLTSNGGKNTTKKSDNNVANNVFFPLIRYLLCAQ